MMTIQLPRPERAEPPMYAITAHQFFADGYQARIAQGAVRVFDVLEDLPSDTNDVLKQADTIGTAMHGVNASEIVGIREFGEGAYVITSRQSVFGGSQSISVPADYPLLAMPYETALQAGLVK